MSDLKKLPGKHSVEDLLKVLENPEDTTPLEKPNEHSVLNFLADFGIYPGTQIVSGRLLYKVYKYHVPDAVHPIEFHQLVSGYVKFDHTLHMGYKYYLNQEARIFVKALATTIVKHNTNKKDKNYHFRLHMDNFLAAHKLKKGSTSVPASFLYFYYDRWQYDGKTKTRLNFESFTGMCRLYFKTKRTEKVWCVVYIDKSFIENNPDVETAMNWSKKFNGSKETKKDITKEKQPKSKN